MSEFGRLSKDRHGAGCTPFRYPGGKACLSDMLAERIKASKRKITTYAEPYAGGAGAAIELLARGVVESVVLNDFDRRIFAAWWAILNRTDEFVQRVLSTKPNMKDWQQAREIVETNSSETDLFELGFATYYLNRTNHSGVIVGAGPIGGQAQTGKWLIDCRWYAETSARRIKWLGDQKANIKLFNNDGIEFLRSFAEDAASETFFFIDPPYVQAGAKLYMNSMNDMKHRDLAKFLISDNKLPNWLVTYDNCALINEVYNEAAIEMLPVKYSLRRKRTENEVCVVPR